MVEFLLGIVVIVLPSVSYLYGKKDGYKKGYLKGLSEGKSTSKELSPEEKRIQQIQLEFEEKRLNGLNSILNYTGDDK